MSSFELGMSPSLPGPGEASSTLPPILSSDKAHLTYKISSDDTNQPSLYPALPRLQGLDLPR